MSTKRDPDSDEALKPGEAKTYAIHIMQVFMLYKLATTCGRFVTLDSCNTNVGRYNGVIAQLAKLGMPEYFLMHCLCHILHNAFEHACCKGNAPWAKDSTKARQGANSPVIFFLEKVSALVVANWDQLGLSEKGVPKCDEASLTRWYSFSRVAFWILQYWTPLIEAARVHVGKWDVLCDSWQQLLLWLQDKDLLLQLHIIADIGNAFLEQAFLWAQDGDGCHAYVIHGKIEHWLTMLFSMYLEPSFFLSTRGSLQKSMTCVKGLKKSQSHL